ncbi:MAG TPA: patatin-like phospholipase family protein, partial [Thermoanaerobaculia bacterium]|nr:patatin-like phospholipase family protein [Thermoanaerobaculia bacterium]
MRSPSWLKLVFVVALFIVLAGFTLPGGWVVAAVMAVTILLAALGVRYRSRWAGRLLLVALPLGLAFLISAGFELPHLLLALPVAFALLAVALRHAGCRSIVSYVFFCRFAMINGLLLVLLALVGWTGRPAGFAPLIVNLFEVETSAGMVLVVFLTVLVGAAVVFSGLLITRSSVAFLDAELPGRRGFDAAWWCFGLLGVIATVAALLRRSPHGPELAPWGAALCGLVAGVLVVVAGRMAALYLARPEVVPNAISRWAARKKIRMGFDLMRQVDERLGAAPQRWRRGYLDERGRLDRGHLFAAVTGGLVLLVYLAGYRVLDPGGGFAPPAMSYVLLLLLLTSCALPLLSFFLDRFRIPTTFALLGLSAVFYAVNDIDHYYSLASAAVGSEPVLAAGMSIPAAAEDDALNAFEARLDRAQEKEPGRPPLVVAVTASGGGITASLWTTLVLSELHRQFPELTDSVHLVSTVSGGSVGAMYFVDALDPQASQRGELQARLDEAVRKAGTSSLSATAWGLVYPDLLRLLGVVPHPERDRGWAQEDAWRRTLRPEKDSHSVPTLDDWRQPVLEGSIPLVIFNATVCETGQRFLLSPLRLKTRNDCGAEPCSDSFAAVSPWSLYDSQRMPVVTAARLSATFPFVSPIARPIQHDGLEDHLAYHVADGGYYDN